MEPGDLDPAFVRSLRRRAYRRWRQAGPARALELIWAELTRKLIIEPALAGFVEQVQRTAGVGPAAGGGGEIGLGTSSMCASITGTVGAPAERRPVPSHTKKGNFLWEQT